MQEDFGKGERNGEKDWVQQKKSEKRGTLFLAPRITGAIPRKKQQKLKNERRGRGKQEEKKDEEEKEEKAQVKRSLSDSS